MNAKENRNSAKVFPPAEMILFYLTEPHHCGLMSWSKSNCGSQSVVQSQRMALSPAEKPESKAAAMPAPSAVGATAAPAKSKTDPPAGGFGSKSIVLFSISLFVLGFSGSYINGRNSYNVRDRVLTDATFGTVGGECEAGVCLSDESRIGEDSKDSSTRRSTQLLVNRRLSILSEANSKQ